MNINKYFFKNDFVKKLLAIVVIIGISYILKSLINTILLTFLFTFIFYNIQKLIFNLLHKHIPIINKKGITISIYIIICLIIVFVSYKYIPVIIRQLIIIYHQVSKFDVQYYDELMNNSILKNFKNIDIKNYINSSATQLIESLTDIGQLSLDILLSLILSLTFNLEKDEILEFLKKFQDSKLDFIYNFFASFGRNFLSIFGKIMRLQLITSTVNSILSFLWLSILGFHQVLGLAFIIFILGLIPVAGILISIIPLCILAFKLGGTTKIIHVLIMMAVLHVVESYIIKPKLMSMEIKLPVFFSFVILVVAEHFAGIWGLLFGIPLFMFFLDIMGVKI